MTLSEFLKDYRRRMNISQRTLAQRCNVSHAYIGFLEKGVNPTTGEPIKPTLANLEKIARGMNIELDSLIDSANVTMVTLNGYDIDPIDMKEESIESQLIRMYRGMTEDGQQRLMEQATMLFDKYGRKDGHEA